MTRSGAMVAEHTVVHRAVLQRHFGHVATGFFHGFLHSSWHFFRFAFAHAYAAITIANHGQCSETENTATLNHLGHAVDRDHLFAHPVFGTVTLHFCLKILPFVFRVRLELQTSFASCFGQSLNATVVMQNLHDQRPLSQRQLLWLFRQSLANQGLQRRCHLCQSAQALAHIGFGSGRYSQHFGAAPEITLA
jgi:hypothetical protein